jgi:hypothetical protein
VSLNSPCHLFTPYKSQVTLHTNCKILICIYMNILVEKCESIIIMICLGVPPTIFVYSIQAFTILIEFL